jgi:predicted class III extradiol MEMO1 family dioxygenase
VAVTNIQSNTNSQSFAAEIVGPATDFYFTGASVDVSYNSASNAAGVNDASQIVIINATMNTVGVGYTATTFESATARAIAEAVTDSRYGDFIGIVNAYNGPPAGAENPSASVALTNILANTSSQSFAAEIVAPMTDVYFTSVTAAVTYENASAYSSDVSQFVINTANISAASTAYTATSVEIATADAIDAADGANRQGDVIGIVKAWQGGGSAALD